MIIAGLAKWNWWYESRKLRLISQFVTRKVQELYILVGIYANIYLIISK